MSQEAVKQLQQDIERIMDLIDTVDDAEVRDRMYQSVQKKLRELKDAKRSDQETQTAVDALDRAIENLVSGNIELAKSKVDIKKLQEKLGFLDKNLPGDKN